MVGSCCRSLLCRGSCRGISRRCGRLGWGSRSAATSSVGFEVRHQLLLFGKHGLQGVQLGLQLLNGDLRLALGGGRVLERS